MRGHFFRLGSQALGKIATFDAVGVSPDHKWAVAVHDKAVVLSNLTQRDLLRGPIVVRQSAEAVRAHFSPGGRWVILTLASGSIVLDLRASDLLKSAHSRPDFLPVPQLRIAFDPSEEQVAAVANQKVESLGAGLNRVTRITRSAPGV